MFSCFDCPQGDLNEVQRSVSKELMQLELALASREKAQADLKMSDEKLIILCVWRGGVFVNINSIK